MSKIELTSAHFEGVAQHHHDMGLTASVVYSKDGAILGAVKMDQDAAAALVAGVHSMPDAWDIESEGGNHLGYVGHYRNTRTGVSMGVYR